MWSFLNPAALFGLFAAGIPLILHLLSRRRVKIVEFSSVEFLNKMKQTKLRYIRLKEILLLIIRTLIIAFIVLGFSNPIYRGKTGTGYGSFSTVILLDDSYSMSRRTPFGTLFETAVSKVSDILEKNKLGDEIAVLPFSKSSDPKYDFLSPDPDYFLRLLPEIKAVPDTTETSSAIMSGVNLLGKANNMNRELVIISDFSKCGWGFNEDIKRALKNFGGNVLLVEVGDDVVENLCLTDVNFGGRIIQPGVGFEIAASVKNGTDKHINKELLDLYLDGARVSETEFSLKPLEDREIDIAAVVRTSGIHYGYVELQEDAIPIDNRRYFSFKVPKSIKLLIAGDDDKLLERIKLASSPPGIIKSHIEVKKEAISKIISMGIGDYDAAIFVDYKPNSILAQKIKSFVDKGKGVFIISSRGIDAIKLSNDLSTIGFPFSIDEELAAGAGSFFKLGDLDISHPIFSVYRASMQSGRQFELPNVTFRSAYTIKVNGRIQTPALLKGDKPLLVTAKSGSGYLAFSTASFSLNNSDISSSSIFLPLIQRMAEYLAAGEGNFGKGFLVNESVQINIGRDFSGTAVGVVTPSKEHFDIQPKEGPSGNIVNFNSASYPGIYFVESADTIVAAFAVNVDTRESEISPADEEIISSMMPLGRFRVISKDDDTAKALEHFRIGYDFTTASFTLVLALLLIEMLLAGRWRMAKVGRAKHL